MNEKHKKELLIQAGNLVGLSVPHFCGRCPLCLRKMEIELLKKESNEK